MDFGNRSNTLTITTEWDESVRFTKRHSRDNYIDHRDESKLNDLEIREELKRLLPSEDADHVYFLLGIYD